MHDAIKFLKKAVSRKPQSGLQGCYLFTDGFVLASDFSLQAGAPLESEANFNVPADELESALERIQSITSLGFDGQRLTIKGGRLRVAIECVEGGPPEFMRLPDVFAPIPAGFTEAVRVASAFIGEKTWTEAIQIIGDRVMAFSNTAGVEVTVPGMGALQTSMSKDCSEFLISQSDAPNEFILEKDFLAFKWSDGRWLRSQTFASIPDIGMLDNILNGAGTEAPETISADLRAAFDDVSALSDGLLTITKSSIAGGRAAVNASVDIDPLAVPAEFVSRWRADVLGKVLPVAKAINLGAYPKPSLFTAENIRGVVLGIMG